MRELVADIAWAAVLCVALWMFLTHVTVGDPNDPSFLGFRLQIHIGPSDKPKEPEPDKVAPAPKPEPKYKLAA